MIVGTAGHIDHGKTTLVRALTGVDTDRLKEEKARGISIELGYAYTPLENGQIMGFIDVPGHERLVHTMVAGACGIDFALLLVAADDGVMPQTREHVAILELFGVTRGAVALSKIDRVDAGRVREVEHQVAALLATTALSGAPIFPLDARISDDPGTAALRRHLHEVAATTVARSDEGLFRLAVDRVFTLTGHGTVVTGTVFSGQVHTGDSVAVFPKDTLVRVRSIHTQNRPAERGRAGERCALNLAGIDKAAIERGDWLADPRRLAPTTRIDVRLQMLPGGRPPLQSGAPVHFHHGSAHRMAHVVSLDGTSIAAGQRSRAQLVLDVAICAAPGDRFIVRDAQAVQTLGGGVILDPFAPLRRRRSPERMRYLDALERLISGEGLLPLLAEAAHGLKLSDLVRLTGQHPERLVVPAGAITVEAGHERYVLLASAWALLREQALKALGEFHATVPDEPGPDIGRLRRIALPQLRDELWRALVAELVEERVVLRSGPWLHLPGHAVVMSESEQVLARKLQPLIAEGRFNPPWVRDLAAALHEPEEAVRQVLRKQVTQGAVYQVVHDLFYDRERVDELAAAIAALAGEHGTIEAARYRDVVGVGRKRAIQILEFFDRAGHTRRVGDSRVLRTDSVWRNVP